MNMVPNEAELFWYRQGKCPACQAPGKYRLNAAGDEVTVFCDCDEDWGEDYPVDQIMDEVFQYFEQLPQDEE